MAGGTHVPVRRSEREEAEEERYETAREPRTPAAGSAVMAKKRFHSALEGATRVRALCALARVRPRARAKRARLRRAPRDAVCDASVVATPRRGAVACLRALAPSLRRASRAPR